MNALAVINTARRYAKNILAKRGIDPKSPEGRAMARSLAASPRLKALARINLSRAGGFQKALV